MKRIYLIQKLLWFLFTIFLANGCESQTDLCNRCRAVGKEEGRIEGKAIGKREGLIEGKAIGKREGIVEGKAIGKDEGLVEGRAIGIVEGIEIGNRLFVKEKWLPTLGGAFIILLFIVGLGIPAITLHHHFKRLWQSYRLHIVKRETKAAIEHSGTSVSDALCLKELEELWQLVNATTIMNLTDQMESASAVPHVSNDRLSQTYQEEFNQMKVRLIGIIATVMDIQNLDRTARFIDVFEAICKQKSLSTENKIQLLDQFKARLSQLC